MSAHPTYRTSDGATHVSALPVRGHCAACGRPFAYEELDAKPEPGADPETADFTRLECRDCYGPGFCEM